MSARKASLRGNNHCARKGKLYIVGIGPGSARDRTFRAVAAIRRSEVIIGYRRYLRLIADLIKGQATISSGMTHEVERCRTALRLAAGGKRVSLVSSGDPGIYGMAGLVFELAAKFPVRVPIEVVPGVTAAAAAAARLGAPLMTDFAVISLSDLLVPWSRIKKRLQAVAKGDLVVALYNPRSKSRTKPFFEAVRIFRKYRTPHTPVGIVHSATCEDEHAILTDLVHVLEYEVGMRSLVIIGSSDSLVLDHRFLTRRGYEIA